MNTKTKNNHCPEDAPDNTRSKMDREDPVTKRQINAMVPDAETRLAQSSSKRLDPNKLRIQFCSAATAERIAKGAVLRALHRRAKSAGKKVSGGTGSIVGPNRCSDVRWLWGMLKKMAEEFAVLIDEDLERLSQPGADRETLVGMIYTHLLCIRATVTIIMGDD